MSAHTPGPWKVHDLYPRVVVTEKDDEVNLLHIDHALGGDGVASAPTEADAKLIAAAPDLLAALQECLEAEERRRRDLKDGSPASSYSDARLARVRAAIAKAEGRAPTRKPTEQERLAEAKAKHEDAMLERRRGL